MEIKFNNVSLFNKNKYLIKNFNYTMKEDVTGVYGDNNSIFARLLLSEGNYVGKILINSKEKRIYPKNKIGYISSHQEFLTETVSDEFYLAKKDLNDSSKKYIEKIISSLKMVGLSKEYLERKNNSLSKSEQKLIQIALSLISNPEIIIFENAFIALDGKNQLRLKKIIQELKLNYQKKIILVDNNINILYELAKEVIILNDNKILLTGTVDCLFDNIDLLKENNIELPDILKFTVDSKNYNKELLPKKNIQELLKEVIKNVSKNNEKV